MCQVSLIMVSNEKNDEGRRRPYQLRTRARRLEETRRRITEALVELHRTVGPARTTVSEVARRAGVRRMTVYNHFPTELEMIDACSSHWAAQHPPPDPGEWRAIEDPDLRARQALERLYAYYRQNADMVGNFLRDAALVPPLREILERKWYPLIDAMAERLIEGRALDGEKGRRTRAAVDVVLAFHTWRTLSERTLNDVEAARLSMAMIRAADADR